MKKNKVPNGALIGTILYANNEKVGVIADRDVSIISGRYSNINTRVSILLE